MQIVKTLRYRLEPNSEQRQRFAQFAGCCRFVFNQGLAARKATYEKDGTTLTYETQSKMLTAMKKADETVWLADVNAQVLQQALKDLDLAYRYFFQRLKTGQAPGFPKFKKKGKKDSFRFPQDVKVNGGRAYLPKIGWVKYRDSRPIEGVIKQATIKREGKHWFISFACEVTLPAPPPVDIKEAKVVGIDLGIKNFAVLSDGTEVENPRHLRRALSKLRKAQRHLSRKTKQSNAWKKHVAKITKLHVNVKNSRKDFAHKVSTAIVKNHDVIAVEDLNISGMVKNRHLSSAISDVGWGLFVNMLKYKTEWAGKHLVQTGRFEATSQLCSSCGTKKPMPLSDRTYVCDGCGMVLDRDLNASLNIRAAGLAVLNACGGA
jgi:putative transposase